MTMQNFQRVQKQFASHIRNPDLNAAPGAIEPRRMKIYSELFYNNIEGFLASGFPVLRAIFAATEDGDKYWHSMVREFIEQHKSRTPYFLEIGQEFLAWLQNEKKPGPNDFTFMLELAHYEWVEVALDVAELDLDSVECDPDADLITGIPVVSPLAWPLVYQYPVHRISPDYQPEKPSAEPVCLVVYRNRQDEVKFVESNPVTVRLLELLAKGDIDAPQALALIAEEMQHPNPGTVLESGQQILEKLQGLDIILGFLQAGDSKS
jgi:hypothetical protein